MGFVPPWQVRRSLLGAVALMLIAGPETSNAQGRSSVPIEVWKSPTCGCCAAWIRHVEAHGFRVKVNDIGNTAARQRLRMPQKLGSCHTATVGRYVIEGHVPAPDIVRLLAQRPDAIGLAVPGMPLGSPGMDGPDYDNQQQPYDVLLVDNDGSTRVFNSYFKRKERT